MQTALENPEKLRTIYTISKLISKTREWNPALDEIIYLAYLTFAFDYIFIHEVDLTESYQTQMIYAKSVKGIEPQDSQFTWELIIIFLSLIWLQMNTDPVWAYSFVSKISKLMEEKYPPYPYKAKAQPSTLNYLNYNN